MVEVVVTVVRGVCMKLNEYIFMCLNDKLNTGDAYTITEDEIEEWIVEWYNDTFPNFRDGDRPRGPPMWLASWRKV